MRRTRRHPTLAVGSVFTLAVLAMSPAAGSATAFGPTTAPGAGARGPLAGSAEASQEQPSIVTLISGDRVRLSRTDDGQPMAQILPNLDGTVPDFETLRDGDDLYVFPTTAASVLASGRVDQELFNITALVKYGFDDARAQSLRLIAQYDEKRAVTRSAPKPIGAGESVALPPVNSVSYAVPKDGIDRTWAELTDASSSAGRDLRKVWLDKPLRATLADSTAQVGAPKAWQQGLDGKGVTVAVLDSGADAAHPDLASRITDSKDFTGSASGAGDPFGHGTHVASTVAGTGAASNGKERGVAPGANLLIGKVLNDSGNGYESQIIAGMQWAVERRADIISMSLGSQGPTTTCDDPIAQAVAELSTSSSSLFVIAAGNIGSSQNTISSPACVPTALTVGAVDSQDVTAQFSSRGPVGGTHVPKPEIAAPGVGILAAATGGRGVYAYRSMSGTSMATPHVSGAAAIAKQANPALTGAQIKNLLTSSADPTVPGGAQEVGAGRLDVARLLGQHVIGQASVYGGSFDYPQPKARVGKTLTYTNSGESAVKLRLHVERVTGNDNRPVNAPLVRLPQHVVVPAGGSVDVPVTVQLGANIPSSSLGDVTARIVATDGTQRVTTAYGMYVAPPVVTVKVKVIDRNGNLASGSSSVDVVNTDTSTGDRRYVDGQEHTYAVRPGRYFVTSFVPTPTIGGSELSSPESVTYLARPEVTIDKDTTIVLDAREAHPLTIATEQPSEQRSSTLTFERLWPTNRVHAGSITASAGTRQAFAQVTGKVAKADGSFEFGHLSRRIAPIVSNMETSGGLQLHPLSGRSGLGNLDGQGSADAVSIGSGSAAEVTAAGVTGKVAHAHLAATADDFAVLTRVAAAGAKALLIHRDGPGTWLPNTAFVTAAVPVYALSNVEGAALEAELAAGPTTVSWSARAATPYEYNLGFFTGAQVVTAQKHVVKDASLGRINADFSSMGLATDFGDMTSVRRPSSLSFAVGGIDGMAVPSSRTQFFSTDGSEWNKSILSSFPFGEVMNDRWRSFTPGQEMTDSWYGGAPAPGIPNDVEGQPQLVAERQGDLIGVSTAIWSDSAGHWASQGSFGDIGNLELKRNGEVTDQLAWPYGVFTVPSEKATYELTLRTAKFGHPARFWKRSVATETTWTFASQEEPEVYSRALPLLMPRLDVPSDGLKTVAAGSMTIAAQVRANPGYESGAITAAKVWTSIDGGTTWVAGAAQLTARGADLVVDHGADSGKQVSLRVELTDALGAKVTQTVTRAYDVR